MIRDRKKANSMPQDESYKSVFRKQQVSGSNLGVGLLTLLISSSFVLPLMTHRH